MKNFIIIISLLLISTSCRAQKNNKYPFENRGNIPIEEIQEAISYNLEKAKYYSFQPIRIPNKYLKPKYFTEKHRQRIIEILQNKWRDDELETHIKASMLSVLDTSNVYNSYYKMAKKIAKRNSLPLVKVWDSMLITKVNKRKKTIKKPFRVPINIIKIAGFIKDKRFVPHFKNILKTGENQIKNTTTLVLARYQIEPYYSKMIEKYKYKDNYFGGLQELSFICSKKAIDEILVYTADNIPRYGTSDYPEDIIDYVAEGAIYSLSYLHKKGDMMLKELEELEEKEFKLDSDWYFPKTTEDLDKMRVILKKYYKNYTINDIDSGKVTIDLGW